MEGKGEDGRDLTEEVRTRLVEIEISGDEQGRLLRRNPFQVNLIGAGHCRLRACGQAGRRGPGPGGERLVAPPLVHTNRRDARAGREWACYDPQKVGYQSFSSNPEIYAEARKRLSQALHNYRHNVETVQPRWAKEFDLLISEPFWKKLIQSFDRV